MPGGVATAPGGVATGAPRAPPFTPQRSYFATVVHNLLMLDYFVIVVLFPFSFYNLVRGAFGAVTLSEHDAVAQLAVYVGDAVFHESATQPLAILGYGDDSPLGLLGKFHNIAVHYSAPLLRKVLHLRVAQQYTLYAYTIATKLAVVATYTLYGLGGTAYLVLGGFFFAFCLGLTVVRRYRGVQRLLVATLLVGEPQEPADSATGQ